MTRLTPLKPAEMTDTQKVVYDAILSGPRNPADCVTSSGALQGPFDPILRAPELGNIVQQLGAQIRFQTSLPDQVRELAILTCARHWRSNFEWFVHKRAGLAAGLSEEIIYDLLDEKEPNRPELKAAFRFVYELNTNTRVSDTTYAAAMDQFQELGVTELTILSGFYATISQILNVFQIPVPEGEETPFAV